MKLNKQQKELKRCKICLCLGTLSHLLIILWNILFYLLYMINKSIFL